jgi:Flp pilus assembly protein TadG
MTSRLRRLAGDAGSLTLFVVIVAIGLYAIAGFVVDAGTKLSAAATARAVAEEAARAGAGQVNESAALGGGGAFTVDPAQAVTAAEAFLSQAGHTGTVIVTGHRNRTVQVTVTVTRPATFTQVIGIRQLTATETATATLVQGITRPQP